MKFFLFKLHILIQQTQYELDYSQKHEKDNVTQSGNNSARMNDQPISFLEETLSGKRK